MSEMGPTSGQWKTLKSFIDNGEVTQYQVEKLRRMPRSEISNFVRSCLKNKVRSQGTKSAMETVKQRQKMKTEKAGWKPGMLVQLHKRNGNKIGQPTRIKTIDNGVIVLVRGLLRCDPSRIERVEE
jgi:hypothetical protein